MSNPLFQSLEAGAIQAPNRILMAPLTRSRAKQPGDVPWELNAEYYRQRAGAGLIITEATGVSPMARGYAMVPGNHTDEQEARLAHRRRGGSQGRRAHPDAALALRPHQPRGPFARWPGAGWAVRHPCEEPNVHQCDLRNGECVRAACARNG